ncbi:PepSY domain-containing protein [Halomonas sp. SH5A2]|uniref:PepSY-associated TM helix domain-containing protein n=1 Tax=Halomonas sp. SH5A2 TaxID=2749040 RepID=UPI00163DF68D|nr:PepSY-associated TM helix domain-containing protein [Halomonas sp. SH5A2]QNI01956.1 PepSY domain-containing protein [Halomonas sp. SH5A2]
MARRSLFSKPLVLLISRLHFYVGLFVGPFVLVAALSGIAYVINPALEAWVYQDTLQGTQQGNVQPLSTQIAAAQHYLDNVASPNAVRPAPEPFDTTRIMFSDPALGPSQHNAVFVDPVTLNVTGEATVYGINSILPLRTQIDLFHRQLLLGDTGRLYSELAASWLWVMALGGIVLWLTRRQALKATQGPHRLAKRHATLGVVLTAGLLLFSATGLTWSQWAGGNIAELRHAWGWSTPSVSTELAAGDTTPQDEHAEHRGHTQTANTQAPAISLITFDHALHAARQAGLEASRLQINPPMSQGQAWRVSEIDRRCPTQVNQVALHPRTMAVIDRTDFATFPLAAKLTRWGIDLHMGLLFGVINQLVLGLLAAGIVVLVVWGYTLWWRRVSRASGHHFPTISEPWGWLPPATKLGLASVALTLGIALPVLGVSLAVFVGIDALRWSSIKRRQSTRTRPNTSR